jgi:hypothetical protein
LRARTSSIGGSSSKIRVVAMAFIRAPRTAD